MVKLAHRRTGERGTQLERAAAARARRPRAIGALLIAVGVAVWPAWLAVNTELEHSGNSPPNSVVGPGVFLLLLASGALITFGRRLRVSGAERALDADTRPPIVYLRPFDADRVAPAPSLTTRMRTRPFRSQFSKRYEQRLARALNKVGPFIAIGNPTERLPQLGAARLYADDSEWQERVDDITDRAGVIILHAGESDGLAWEVQHVVDDEPPERVILSLPLQGTRGDRSRQERYDAFRSKFGDVFPRPLPERIGDSQFLYFDEDWTPQLFGERGAAPVAAAPGSTGAQRALALGRLGSEFKITFAPFWARSLVYTAAVGALIVGLLVVSGYNGASSAVDTCTGDRVDAILASDPGSTAEAARRVAKARCEALDARGLLDDAGVPTRTTESTQVACRAEAAVDAIAAGMARRDEIIRRFCAQLPSGGLSPQQTDEAIRAIAAQLGVQP